MVSRSYYITHTPRYPGSSGYSYTTSVRIWAKVSPPRPVVTHLCRHQPRPNQIYTFTTPARGKTSEFRISNFFTCHDNNLLIDSKYFATSPHSLTTGRWRHHTAQRYNYSSFTCYI